MINPNPVPDEDDEPIVMIYLVLPPEDYMTLRDGLEHMTGWGSPDERDRAHALLDKMPPNGFVAETVLDLKEL